MELFKKLWSKLPNKASFELPNYYNSTPRLDAVRTIAEHCSTQELKLYKKSDYRKDGKNAEPIAEHELYELLDNPVPAFKEIDGYSLRYFTFTQLELVGECAWLKIREGKRIVALLPVLKSWIKETPTEKNNSYKIIPYGDMNGNVLTVPVEDLVIFKDIDIADPYGRGKGLAESLVDELETDEFASKYQKNFFYNDATPPYLITGFVGNQEQADKVKTTLMQKIGGFFHAREPAILTGDPKITTLGIAPKELDMVESRKYLRDECLHHFRIPPELMGIIENSNRSTIDASFYLMQKNVLPARLARFERTLNRQLLPDFDKDLICKHNFECDEDKEFKLKVFQFGLEKGTITREEFRTAFGLEAEIKEGTLILPVMSTITNADEEVNLDDIQSQEVELPDDDEGKSKLNFFQKDEREAFRIKAWKMFDTKALSGEDRFKNSCRKIAKKQLDDLTEVLKTYNLSKPIENAINDYYTKDVDSKTKSTLANAWINSLNDGKNNAVFLMGNKAVESLDNTVLINAEFNKWIEKYGLEKSVLINDTTKKKLVKKLKEILAEDDIPNIPEPEVRKRLIEGAKEITEELSKSRADVIARTETGATVNFGQMITYKEYGAEKKEWLASYDNRTRDTHLMASGQVVNIDDTFDVGGEQLLYPIDPNGSAENCCNCRCTILSYFE